MRLITWPTPAPVVAPAAIEPIEATYPSRRAFLEHVQIGAESCRLFWPGSPKLRSGTRVFARIRIASLPDTWEVVGRIVQAREDLRGPAHSGLVIEVRGPALLQIARAYATARGNPPEMGRRSDARVPVELPATLALADAKLETQVLDLSRGGAFVELSGPGVLPGTAVGICIRAGWFRRIDATARVTWQGRRDGRRGIGLEFVEMPDSSRKRLLEALERR